MARCVMARILVIDVRAIFRTPQYPPCEGEVVEATAWSNAVLRNLLPAARRAKIGETILAV
jgi:hypothetical protein